MKNLIPLFKPRLRDSLFYGRFEYCLDFHLEEANVLRDLDHETIDATIVKRRIWREMAEQRWAKAKLNHVTTIWRTNWKKINEQTVANLHDMADTLLESKDDYKLVVTVDQGWVYTNSLNLIQKLDTKDYFFSKSYSQAIIDRPRDTIRLKHSPHKYRSYIRHVKLHLNQKEHLQDFFYNHGQDIRVSPAFSCWFDQPWNRTQDWFFIDYDSPQWLTMLGLVCPGLIRKTVQIIPAK